MYSLNADPKTVFIDMRLCFTLTGCSPSRFYHFGGQKISMLITNTEPQPKVHRTCAWFLETSFKGLYHLAMWQCTSA